MRVYTDNIDYANYLLDSNNRWQTENVKKIAGGLHFLSEHIFDKQTILTTEFEHNRDWNYLFIKQKAKASQYDILVQLLNQNLTQIGKILCFADSGSGFHGFKNRNWVTVPGNIHLAMLLTPNREIKNFFTGFIVLAAVSVLQTIDAISGLAGKASIKWVNDILINNSMNNII